MTRTENDPQHHGQGHAFLGVNTFADLYHGLDVNPHLRPEMPPRNGAVGVAAAAIGGYAGE